MRRSFYLLLSLMVVIGCSSNSIIPHQNGKEAHIPYLQENEGHALQFMVDGKPMLLIAAEPLNSTGSYPARLDEVLAEMKAAHYNTALIAVSWQLIEPAEGIYDFTSVADILTVARKNNIKLGLLWFGAWKNGISPYVPSWVLGDTKRFERVVTPGGENSRYLSPFCDETMKFDAKAYGELMAYLAKNDQEHTVILMQLENELGLSSQTRDFSEKANTAFAGNVPEVLMNYMTGHKKTLEIELVEKWKENGFKTSGSWEEVFGKNNYTDMFFMAWTFSKYVNTVAEEGKKAYALPMYVNCWVNPFMSADRPNKLVIGEYPSGGPFPAAFDIWKAGAPNVDFLSPDIYDNKKYYIHPARFHRSDNPLFVPEMNVGEGRATYLFAEHDAMGTSPFGQDGQHKILANENEFLQMMMPVISKYQGTRKMHGFMRWSSEDESLEFKFDDEVTIVIDFNKRTPWTANRNETERGLPPAYGLLILTSDNEFIVGGLNVYVSAKSTNPKKEVWLNNVREGFFDENGEWKQLGIRNGDEAGYLSFDTPHYSIGKFQGYYQGAVGSLTIPAVFKFEVIKYDKSNIILKSSVSGRK